MADDAPVESGPAAAEPAAEPAATAEPDAKGKGKGKGKAEKKGLLRRMWNGIFGGRGEDFEKRLQYLSKEEAAAHARMQRRAQGWRKTARNVVVCSIISEVVAVFYAIISTRMDDLSWETRALKVLPMFLFPGVSYVIYSTLASFTKMRDRKDQRTLERLRAERQAKIDELKERTNYYSTQQLIQKYDLDPAAKAAAATVLASKLGAESGLKVFVGDESKNNGTSGRSHDAEVFPSEGLRNRKHPGRRSNDGTSSVTHPLPPEGTQMTDLDAQHAPVPGEQFVEHYKGKGNTDGGWIARLAAMLVGEDPSQSYALICGNCRMHNGLARKEDFPYITYYCPHCHALNGHRHVEGQGPISGITSRNSTSPASENADVTPKASSVSPPITEAETDSTSHAVTDPSPQPVTGSDMLDMASS